MAKYNFQLGTGNSQIRFKVHFSLESDMYVVMPHFVKISFHKSGQAHLKPTTGGEPTLFDAHEFLNDIYTKKSRLFARTNQDLPEKAGAIGIIRPEKLFGKISSPQFLKPFNPRKIVVDPTLFGDAYANMNFHNMRMGLDTLIKQRSIGEKDLAMYCYLEQDEICFSYGDLSTRYEMRLNPLDEKSLNQVPGYEIGSPAMKQFFSKYLL